MNILIIEDEAPAFRRLQKLLEEINDNIEILEVLDTVEESVSWLKTNTAPELIFMDIQLSDGISFDIFDQVTVTSPVIFTTAFDEYMLKAFKVNSIDYLLKPIKKEELVQSLEKYDSLRKNFSASSPDLNLKELVESVRLDDRKFKSRFLVKMGDKLIAIETSDIAYFYTHHGVVYLMTNKSNKYLIDYNLDELQQSLDPDVFYRANRQFILHFKSIQVVHKYHKGKLLVELDPKIEDQVIVSTEKATDFKNWLGDR